MSRNGTSFTNLVVFTSLFAFASLGCASKDADLSTDSESGGETEPTETGEAAEQTYLSCDHTQSAGRFTVQLQDTYTQVEGQVFDGVNLTPKAVLDSAQGCELVEAVYFSCDPGCDSDSVCTADGCQLKPDPMSVGPITISGLAAEVSMDPNVVNFYLNLGELPFPGFAAEADVRLSATGEGENEGFELRATGSEDLEILGDTITVAADEAVALSWTPPTGDADTRIHIDLDVGHHGGSPARIECELDDTGSFEIPASLVNPLLDFGIAGFPAITITRRSVDAVTIDDRCVELVVAPHAAKLDVAIEGLISCNSDDDCPDAMTCLADLSCG